MSDLTVWLLDLLHVAFVMPMESVIGICNNEWFWLSSHLYFLCGPMVCLMLSFKVFHFMILTYHFVYSRTILDIDINSFEEKPWTHPGTNISDFFNYGFDDGSWKNYCDSLVRNSILILVILWRSTRYIFIIATKLHKIIRFVLVFVWLFESWTYEFILFWLCL